MSKELRVPLEQRFLIVNQGPLPLEVISDESKFVIPVHGHLVFQPGPHVITDGTMQDWGQSKS